MDKLAAVGKYYPNMASLPAELLEASQQHSFTLTSAIEECDYLLVLDATPQILRRAVKSKPKRTRLVIFEPEVVWPFGMSQRTTGYFDDVIFVGRPCHPDYSTLPYPQNFKPSYLDENQKPRDREKFPLVNANKHSAIKGELYSLRRAALLADSRILVRGASWEMPLHKVAKSAGFAGFQAVMNRQPIGSNWLKNSIKVKVREEISVRDKRAFLSGFDQTLVIENSLEYMTEKLFDAFFSGSYPVYVGPDPSKFGVPEQLLTLSEPTVEQISRAMDNAVAIDKLAWRQRVSSWLSSESVVEEWSAEKFYSKLLDRLRA